MVKGAWRGTVKAVRRVSVREMLKLVRRVLTGKVSQNQLISRNEKALLPANKHETNSDDR
jgi:hypothetical protein